MYGSFLNKSVNLAKIFLCIKYSCPLCYDNS